MRPRSSTSADCVKRQRDIGMLLDQDEGVGAFAGHAADRGGEFLDDDGGQAFERLVEQEQRRIGHQRARDRQHLLLAAGQLIAEIAAAFGDAGEQVVHRGQVPAAVARRHGEVFLHRQRRKNLAFLRHPADAGLGAAMRRALGDVLAAPQHAAAADLGVAHDGQKQRRFADAVPAEHGEPATLRQFERDAVEHDRRAVAGADVAERKQRCRHDTASWRALPR